MASVSGWYVMVWLLGSTVVGPMVVSAKKARFTSGEPGLGSRRTVCGVNSLRRTGTCAGTVHPAGGALAQTATHHGAALHGRNVSLGSRGGANKTPRGHERGGHPTAL